MSGRLRRLGADSQRVLRISAVLTLIALALMMWSLVQPTVWPVMLAMSVAQGMGTLALGLYLLVVVRDLRGSRDAAREKDRE
jgi:hypothetical protein